MGNDGGAAAGSAEDHADSVHTRILEGVANGTNLLLDDDILARYHVHISPFGAIAKGDGSDPNDIRLIHDLSFPPLHNVNISTEPDSIPAIRYTHVAAIAKRIEDVHRAHPGIQVGMLKGDVSGAFRHLRHHACDVHWMGGCVPKRKSGVIDLSAPFGWTGSPALYGLFGRAISYLVGRESPATMSPGDSDTMPFFSYEWVDDHIMVEPAIGDRQAIAEDTLRLSMNAILAPKPSTNGNSRTGVHEPERSALIGTVMIALCLSRPTKFRKRSIGSMMLNDARLSLRRCYKLYWAVSGMCPAVFQLRGRSINASRPSAQHRRGLGAWL